MNGQLHLEQFVAIQAALEGGQAREAVLAASGISVDEWEAERERWLGRVGKPWPRSLDWGGDPTNASPHG